MTSSRLLRELNDFRVQASVLHFSRAAATAAMRIGRADVSAYLEADPRGRTIAFDALFDGRELVRPDASVERLARCIVDEGLDSAWSRARAGRACRIEDFLSPHEFRATPIHHNILEPMGVSDLAVMTLRICERGRVWCVVLGRRNRPFSASERATLSELAELMGAHLESSEYMGGSNRSRTLCVNSLSWVRWERLITTPEGAIVQSSRGASELLRTFFGPSVRFTGELPEELLLATRQAPSTWSSTPSAVFSTPKTSLRVYVWPALKTGENLLRLEHRQDIPNATLQRALGLTTTSCEIVREVLRNEGLSLREIAQLHSRQLPTLQTHMKNIRYKLELRKGKALGLRGIVEDRLSQHLREAAWSAENDGSETY